MEGNQQRAGAIWLAVAGALAACLLNVGTVSAQAVEGKSTVGRFVALGTTEAPSAWKSTHPSDENFIYLLDSVTGRIEICSDVEGVCRTIPGSERDAKGSFVGRFTGLKIAGSTAAWKARHPSDDHLILSLDSTNARIQACGNMDGGCAFVSSGQADVPNQWPKVVMLYRRADSAAIAGRMYDRFIAHYGNDAVFMDIYKIPLATDWREQVNNMSLHGGVLVALIGPRWIGKLPDGHVRIHDLDDPVRNELETALGAGIPIFPVLVEGAGMPRAEELPDSLKNLPSINAAIVDTGRDFDHHMARLIDAIDQRLATRVMPQVPK